MRMPRKVGRCRRLCKATCGIEGSTRADLTPSSSNLSYLQRVPFEPNTLLSVQKNHVGTRLLQGSPSDRQGRTSPAETASRGLSTLAMGGK